MNNITENWRQVRIFTTDFSPQYYFTLLSHFVVPFHTKYPETVFWITRYDAPNGTDNADTKINELPARFIQPGDNKVFSLRLRFQPASNEEAFLEGLFPDPANGKFWRSHFDSFKPLEAFGDDRRFCTAVEPAEKSHRANLLAHLFYYNSLFILDSFKHAANPPQFEENNHPPHNTDYHTTFASVIHILANPTGQTNGTKLPLMLLHPTNQQMVYYL